MLAVPNVLKVLLTLAVAVGATSGCSGTPLEGDFVRAEELQLEIWAPKGWIVRSFIEDGERHFAISRGLQDAFPRYLVGFNAAEVNILRKKAPESPLGMARWLCQRAQDRGIATAPCRETTFHKFQRIEWQVRYPVEAPSLEPTIALVVCLADDKGDNLMRLIFEAPESEWPAVQRIAQQMMSTIKIAGPST